MKKIDRTEKLEIYAKLLINMWLQFKFQPMLTYKKAAIENLKKFLFLVMAAILKMFKEEDLYVIFYHHNIPNLDNWYQTAEHVNIKGFKCR